MNNRQRWAVVLGALLLATVIGAIAFNIGVNYGAEDAGRVVREYRWHPWGFAPFFFFVFFCFFLLRGLFWGGRWHRRCAWDGGLDDWHRRAHERMGNGEREQQDDPDRRR